MKLRWCLRTAALIRPSTCAPLPRTPPVRRVRAKASTHQPARAQNPQLTASLDDGTVTCAMMLAIIPLGLRTVEEALPAELRALAGARFAHHAGRPDVVRSQYFVRSTEYGLLRFTTTQVRLTLPLPRTLQHDANAASRTYSSATPSATVQRVEVWKSSQHSDRNEPRHRPGGEARWVSPLFRLKYPCASQASIWRTASAAPGPPPFPPRPRGPCRGETP